MHNTKTLSIFAQLNQNNIDMTKVISVLNYKGGAGKTTTTANLGTALWIMGKKVLLIDSDIQCNLTFLLGFDQSEGDPTLHEWLLKDCPPPVYDRYPGLHYIPTKDDEEFENKLDKVYHREDVLRDHLELIKEHFDYILIDCSFKAGLTNTNALNASDSLLIPAECASFSLQGMTKLMDTFHQVKSRMNKKLEIEGILYTKYMGGTRFSKKMTSYLKEDEEYAGHIFNTCIRKNVRFDESPIENKTVFEKDVNANGAEDYMLLAEEITGEKRPYDWKERILHAWLNEKPNDEEVIKMLADMEKKKKSINLNNQ